MPELRFPDFVGDGEWEKKELGKVCKMQAGKFVSASEINEKLVDGLFSCYGGNGLRGYTKSFTHTGKFSLIGRQGALCGNVNLVDDKFHATEHAIVVIPEKNIDKIWLFYTLELLKLNQYATGQAQPGLSVSNLKKVKLNIPKNEKEQKKIASCISSLDEILATQNKKLENLKNHKKGLMQKLFPQEGEKVPKLRFSEFLEDEDWEKSPLVNLGQFLGGGTPNKSNSSFWEGNIPWISSSDIDEDDIHTISITRFINAQAVKKSATKIIPNGSVLFVSRVGVGKLAINRKELCTSQDFTNFISETVLNYFIGYFFSAKKHLLQSLNQGTSIKGFSKSDLENFELFYPKNPKEQKKIASCLISIDDLITTQTKKIAQLKLHKKGLMQGLFPDINENI